jgi:hypothetical protein
MKTIKLMVIIFICYLLFSCHTEDNPAKAEFYTKCFFIDEKSFTFEGTTYNNFIPPLGWPEVPKFESVTVKLSPPSYVETYEGWEIPGLKLAKDKFRIEIDKTANGITIDRDTILNGEFYKPYNFPNGFPVVELMFCFNGSIFWYDDVWFREPYRYDKREFDYFYCSYLFVAEPIDLSDIIVGEGKNVFGQYYVHTHYYDLNFSKPGWYKIINDYHSKFNNDSKFSSTKNNFFEGYN